MVGAALALLAIQGRSLSRPMNVVVVTLDTTRADRLSAYGFASGRTPALDRLAREGLVFDYATSVAPLTRPAHASLFTARVPPHHGVRDNAGAPLATQPTLAELLRERGLRTGAFVSSIVLQKGTGIEQGFDIYNDTSGAACDRVRRRRPGDETVTEALRWLRTASSAPFFLWVHLYDAHQPYQLPRGEADATIVDPYADAISFMDRQLARVLDYLDRQDLRKNTIVVVAGDHGESLGEHGEQAHGIFVYESVLHVPLLISVPGFAPRRIAGVVSIVDVMPTILDLVGVTLHDVDGVSLLPAIARGEADREVYSETLYPQHLGWSALRALRAGRYKAIAAPKPELYDLLADPWEEHNLAEGHAIAMAAMLERISEIDTTTGVAAAAPIDSDRLRQLAALGYIGGAPRSQPVAASGADPKDEIAEYEHRMATRVAWLLPERCESRIPGR